MVPLIFGNSQIVVSAPARNPNALWALQFSVWFNCYALATRTSQMRSHRFSRTTGNCSSQVRTTRKCKVRPRTTPNSSLKLSNFDPPSMSGPEQQLYRDNIKISKEVDELRA